VGTKEYPPSLLGTTDLVLYQTKDRSRSRYLAPPWIGAIFNLATTVPLILAARLLGWTGFSIELAAYVLVYLLFDSWVRHRYYYARPAFWRRKHLRDTSALGPG
jgi:hypothetical protein